MALQSPSDYEPCLYLVRGTDRLTCNMELDWSIAATSSTRVGNVIDKIRSRRTPRQNCQGRSGVSPPKSRVDCKLEAQLVFIFVKHNTLVNTKSHFEECEPPRSRSQQAKHPLSPWVDVFRDQSGTLPLHSQDLLCLAPWGINNASYISLRHSDSYWPRKQHSVNSVFLQSISPLPFLQ